MMWLLLVSHVSAGCGNFYKDINYSGGDPKQVCEGEEYVNLSSIDWNDKISSYQIDSGTECVVTKHSNFSGDYLTLKSGNTATSMPSGWNDQITSVKCAASGYFTNNVQSGQVAVYEHNHYAGAYQIYTRIDVCENLTNYHTVLNGPSWNDRISSIRVASNMKATFYKDTGCNNSGTKMTLTGPSNNRSLSSDWNDQISSLKITLK